MAAAPTRWSDERLDDDADRLSRFEGNVDLCFDRAERSVGERFDKVDARFDRFERSVDARFDKVDERFDRAERSVDARFDMVDDRFDRFEAKVDKRFNRMEGEMRAGFASAAEDAKAASAKLDANTAVTNRAVWTMFVAAGIAKLLFG